MTKIEHIVFDVGKVLVHWDPELVYLNLIPDADERTHFLTKICSPEWNAEQDRGRDWEEAEDLLIAEHPEKAELIRAYRTGFLGWLRNHGAGKRPESMNRFGELLRAVSDPRERRDLPTLFEDVYGVPLSAESTEALFETDTLESRFLKWLPKS